VTTLTAGITVPGHSSDHTYSRHNGSWT